MKALLYKSFLEIRGKLIKLILVILLAVLFLSFLLTGEYNILYCLLPFVMAGALSMNVPYMDEKSHWNKYCDFLPISRKEVVLQSLFAVLILNTLMLVIVAAVRIAGLVINHMAVSPLNIAEILPAYLCGFGLISIIYCFVFSFNYDVGMVIYVIVCGASGGIVGFTLSYYEDFGKNIFSLNISDSKTLKIYLIISAVSIMIAVVSWIVSIRVYSKRSL